MDGRGQFRERRHILQEGRRRTPVAAVAGVHGSRGATRRGARPDPVGEARVGRRPGVGQGGGQDGRARRPVPVRGRGDGPASGQGLLRGQVVANRSQPGRLRGRRDIRRTPGRQAAGGGRGPWHRARLQVPDRTVWFGPVQSTAFVASRYEVSVIFGLTVCTILDVLMCLLVGYIIQLLLPYR